MATCIDLRGVDVNNLTYKKFYSKLNIISKLKGVVGGVDI